MRFSFIFIALISFFPAVHSTRVALAEPIWDLQKLSQAPNFRWEEKNGPIKSLILEGPAYQDLSKTEVFAFYATPGSIRGEQDIQGSLPAVVCLHGGGGTAFAEWVYLWASRGYAAIALDFSGRKVKLPMLDADSGQPHFESNHRKIERQTP